MISFTDIGLKPTTAMKEAIAEPDAPKDPNIGVMRFLCSDATSKQITGKGEGGDDRIIWDRRFLDSIKEARERFYELLDKGYKAFSVLADGKRSRRQVFEFSPDLEEIILVAPVAAG